MAQVTSPDTLPCIRPGAPHPSLSGPTGSCTLWDAASHTVLTPCGPGDLCTLCGAPLCSPLPIPSVCCLVSECLEPIPPDAPDTAAPARLGWTSPHRGGRSVHRVALVSPSVPPPSPRPPGPRCLPPGATRRGPEGGELAAYRLPKHCIVLGRWRAWVAKLQARHALRCIRAFSGRVE